MKRRTLLHNLLSSIVAVPVLGAHELSFNAFVEPDDERHMRRAWQACAPQACAARLEGIVSAITNELVQRTHKSFARS